MTEANEQDLAGTISSEESKRIYIVDGSGLLYRAYYAFLRQRLSHGALFGFVSTLLALIREENARYLAVAFDLPGETFRHQIYSDYKANREETPPELVEQFPEAQEMVSSMGLQVLTKPGFEADDLIGSLASQYANADWQVTIVSGDKDFAQLVNDSITQYIPSRGPIPASLLTESDILDKYGILPAQFIDYLALIGDKSDNIPGVHGIGPKGATKLLQEWKSLEGIYEHIDEIKPAGAQAKLIASREQAFLSQDLARIRTNLDDLDQLDYAVPEISAQAEFRAQLERFSFRAMLSRIFGSKTEAPTKIVNEPIPDLFSGAASESDIQEEAEASAGAPSENPIAIADGWDEKYQLVKEITDLDRILSEFKKSKQTLLCIDTETASLDCRRTKLAGISFSWRPGEAYYIALGHKEGPNLPLKAVQERLNPILASPAIIKLGQNLKFDLHSLRGNGFTPEAPFYDTMIASYLCDPEVRHSLDYQSEQVLGHRMLPISALIGTGRKQLSMTDVPAKIASPYACEDVDAVIRLWPHLRKRLEEIEAWSLFLDMEMPLLPVLTRMEARGIKLDTSVLEKMEDRFGQELESQESEIHELAGETFNLNSPKQLQVILFDKLKLKPGRKTKTGFSTNQNVLEELARDHPLPGKLLAYRQLTKLLSTYILALPKMVDPETGRIHASFHQTVAATGRLSSSDPNLQNIPIRTKMGREIRRAFIAPPGRTFLSIDYSQIELRLMAHLSEDEHLVKAFTEDADIHAATAALIFSIPEAEVSPEQRNQAKTVNFGVIYGMGSQRLARQLHIPVPVAREFIGGYFEKLPGVKAFIDSSIEQAKTKGYAQTIMGRRRYLPDIYSPRHLERSTAERMSVNTPVQGSAADLIKLAMLRVNQRIEQEMSEVDLILQVHDELVFEVPEDRRDKISRLVESEMVSVLPLRVPLKVATGYGSTWFDAHA